LFSRTAIDITITQVENQYLVAAHETIQEEQNRISKRNKETNKQKLQQRSLTEFHPLVLEFARIVKHDISMFAEFQRRLHLSKQPILSPKQKERQKKVDEYRKEEQHTLSTILLCLLHNLHSLEQQRQQVSDCIDVVG